MKEILDRFVRFLNNAHPLISIPIKLFLTLVLGIGALVKGADNLLTKLFAIIGTLLVWASMLGFILWIAGSGAEILDILQLYGTGQGCKVIAWISRAWNSKEKKNRVSTP